MQEKVLGIKIPRKKLEICKVCIKGKQTQTPFPNSERKSKDLLEIIHTDICGPIRDKTIGGSRYFAVFIDDYSRWCVVNFLSNKSDVFAAFKEYAACSRRIRLTSLSLLITEFI